MKEKKAIRLTILFCLIQIIFWSFVTKGFFPANLLIKAFSESIWSGLGCIVAGLLIVFMLLCMLLLLGVIEEEEKN